LHIVGLICDNLVNLTSFRLVAGFEISDHNY